MARPIDETTPDETRRSTLNDTTTGRVGARTSIQETEVKRHRGGSTLWIILAVVAAILLALWLFSGAFSSNPEVGTGADGVVTDETVVVPEGSTVDGAPVTDGVTVEPPADGAATDAPATVPGN